MKSNYAFFIANFHPYWAEKMKIQDWTTISPYIENSFEIFSMKGIALEPYEMQAQALCDFISKSHNMIFETIALDFIKDEKGIIYFVDCHGFTIINHVQIQNHELMSDEEVRQMKIESQEIYDKANNTV